MSSDQAATLVEADTVVIPTTSIPKGIAALFQYDHHHLKIITLI